jgi:hypothetical protein
MSMLRQPANSLRPDPSEAPEGPWTSVLNVGRLLLRAWMTPQRICGCKRPRVR